MGESPWIVSDELWKRIEPLLPRTERRFRYPGRKPLPDRQVLCGTPLAVILTCRNRNDVTQLLPLLDAVPPVRGRVGRLRRRTVTVFADHGYDHDCHRKEVRARHRACHRTPRH